MGSEQSQLRENEKTGEVKRNLVSFLINGKGYNVYTDHGKFGPESRLIDFIRDDAGLKGTKFMCREGGCGACVVTVTTRNQGGEEMVRSINSCLTPVFSCDGYDITTIEALGSTKTGKPLHPIQERMIRFSGSQCGYCTPGWIMNMYGLTQSKKPDKLYVQDIEDSMDGNICRCTGYRPILDAMKSMASDASEELQRKCGNIPIIAPCLKNPELAEDELTEFEKLDLTSEHKEPVGLHLDSNLGPWVWVKAVDLNMLFSTLEKFQANQLRYRVVAGNTGTGVFKEDGPYQAYVELNSIPILTQKTVTPTGVILGGAVTISQAIESMKKASEFDGYTYCKQVHKHWKRVAGTPVRNAATLAGNLMLKHDHPEFPSDIFLILETIGAMLTIASAPSLQQMYTPFEFLNLNMMGKIILSIHFPRRTGFYFRSFKITRRYQNTHAYINAGFLMHVTPSHPYKVLDKPTIVFGGIAPNFVHAVRTELFLMGKFLDEKIIQGVMATLDSELIPNFHPPDADPIYRKNLAQSLLYKFMLAIMNETLTPKIKSGWLDIEHGLTYAKQSYDTHKEEWPLYEPVPKLEAPIQCTGEAEYINDIHLQPGELHGAFVLAKVGSATIAHVDPSEALKIPGVVSFVTAKDIPGINNYMSYATVDKPDVIFAEDKVLYAGQPIGLIVAENRELALKVSKLVRIVYTNVQKPTLDFPAALDKLERENKLAGIFKIVEGPKSPVGDSPHSIKGEFRTGGQAHFTMEPQTCLCIPKEDGMDVFMATQWMTQAHYALVDCLAMPSNAINIQIRRLGGGFGAKLARGTHVATACAVAANKLKRPVRLVVDLESSMSALGQRHPYLFKYTVGFDDNGKVMEMTNQLICNTGATTNEQTADIASFFFQNCYAAINWKLSTGAVNTNIPPNTFCRAPGSTQAIASIENIMEHIAAYLKKDPLEVRMVNFFQKGDPILMAPGHAFEIDNQIPGLIGEIKQSCDFDERQKFVENFNLNNRWKKRGISLVPMCHQVPYLFSGYSSFVVIYAKDGSVAVSHAGIEMGQGINTKVAQVVAKTLGIPLSKVKVKPVNNLISANSTGTATGITSETVCHSAMKACEILLARLAPVREKLGKPTWEVLVEEGHKVEIDLKASYNATFKDFVNYHLFGTAVAEAEIDALTGEFKIIRMDIISDAGMSLSPEVDIGQVEGSSIMGLGLWLTEKLQRNENTGQLLTNRTWEYKPPAPKDIPEDFRVSLMKNSKNPFGVLGSKTTGEASLCMSVVAFFAVKHAITAARADAGTVGWFPMDGPVTPEDIHRLCLTATSQFTI